ncbi:hypothetical protein Psta_4210 [Pirellula staleyi DSM 6068]|uniref:Uncharacterized protein n=1 Tax=Pirellula staleyi (strain ATCC 27377 / DSM 6068 / ICPB 4128) TaxID=530564 RepID=D2R409_PIRSD|nr:hypothetical protein [Pirellula staleyi]ADB18858.1 hypothetical protein Psta_4210 [Pirellula staleyi DSM 6068]
MVALASSTTFALVCLLGSWFAEAVPVAGASELLGSPAVTKISLLADVAPFPNFSDRKMARAVGLAAIAGLIILGFTMVGLVWWGARYTRRYMNQPSAHHPTPRPPADDWIKP